MQSHRCLTLIISMVFVYQLTLQATAQQDPRSSQQLAKFADLSAKLETLAEARELSGTVLLAEDGKIVFEKSAGFQNIDQSEVLTDNSSFRLGSVSKQFAAMAVMLLQADGKLDYDDDIRKFMPNLKYEGITVRNLLHHTSGLPDYMVVMGKHWQPKTPLGKRKIAFNQDVVDVYAKHQPDLRFEPGEKFEYSNTGYVFLGQIIEEASGMPAATFVAERIFKPLGMSQSCVFTDEDSFTPDCRVYGFSYASDGSGHRPNDWHYLNGMFGDGGVYATARDLLKWDQALYTDKIISQKSLAEAFTPGTLNDGSATGYGFGWSINDTPEDGLVVSHGGGWVGFATYIVRDTKNRRTWIVLTNNSCRKLRVILNAIKAVYETEEDG